MNGEAMHVNGSNGAAPAAAAGEPSVETLLFKAGLITADQLGEVVLERVQSGRPAGEIVVERGLVSPEALAGALAGPAAPAVETVQAPVAETVAAPAPAPVVEASAEHVPAVAVSEPVVPVAPPAPEPVEATVVAPPAPEPVEATVVAPPVEPAPVHVELTVEPVQPQPEPQPEPPPAAAAESDEHGFSMGEVHYGIRIRLAEGVTLEAGSYPSRERAIEVARGIAGQLAAEGGEWPLVGDTLVRPDAVLAIEIESAVSWFSSNQA